MKTEPAPQGNPKFAWQAIARAEPPKRSATERVGDFFEIYWCLDEAAAREQASRCIQCPEPVCVKGCPLHNRIPEWLALTAEGHFLEAAQLLEASGCLGDVFSRICARPCETECILEGRGEPVAINAVERFLDEYGRMHLPTGPPPPPNGGRVAVLDAGPCGLACAHDLARRGYAVTVMDAHPVPGGLLVNGVPAFKLEKSVVQRQIAVLQQLGVTFRLGVKCGQDITLWELRHDFDAVFMGSSAGQARPLDLPGAHLGGIYQGLTFIVQRNLEVPLELAPIEVQGRRVVVLGGGDTAMHCLRTALRCQPAAAVCLYRRDEQSLPAARREYLEALEEGAEFQFQVNPLELLGNSDGQVTHVRCVRTSLGAPDSSGRRQPQPVPGTEFNVPADVVLVAFGFTHAPCALAGDWSEIALGADGRVKVDAHLMTNLPGVFAGGALVREQPSVLDAVRDARQAATAIHGYLTARGVSQRAD